jgi:predicted secreted protein
MMSIMSRRFLSVSALCIGLFSASVFAQESTPERRIINLQADISRDVKNDQMLATLFTEQTNLNPTALAKDIANVMNDATEIAKRFPTVKISTGSQNTYPLYNEKNKLTGWRSRAEVQIKSTDFKAASELVAQLQAKMQLEQVRFDVSTEQRQNIENQLLTEVSAAFQQRASLLQKAWNASQFELVRLDINTSSDQPQPYPMMYARDASAKMEGAVAPQQVEGGNSQIRVSANGSIQLK